MSAIGCLINRISIPLKFPDDTLAEVGARLRDTSSPAQLAKSRIELPLFVLKAATSDEVFAKDEEEEEQSGGECSTGGRAAFAGNVQ